MNILLTADLHVHNWGQYSEYDEVGVPSRLRLYECMFADLAALARLHGARHIVLAGDLLQTHSPKPMVANVVSDGLALLATDDTEVHVIPGNHDVDQKSGRFDIIHSGLRPLIPAGVHYYAEPTMTTLYGNGTGGAITAYFYPWLHAAPDYAALPEATVFVGHGMVQGSVDPFGHHFTNGYDATKLLARYRLSVIGDIHQAQVFNDRPLDGPPRHVLIPGQPIPVNHSSGTDTGVWLWDTESGELSRIPTREFGHAAEYHQFVTLDEPPSLPVPATTHVRVRRPAAVQTVAADAVLDDAPSVDLLAEARAVWQELRRDDTDAGLAVLDAAYAKTASGAAAVSVPAALVATRLDIRNFYSVASLSIDFEHLTGDVLVAGQNGSGKSSIPDAFYWCVTGKNTRGSSAGELSNSITGKPAQVALTLAGGGNTYVIARSRDPAHLLHLHVNGADVTKASSTETQDMIYQLLGLTGHDDVLALAYYSCVAPCNFTACTTGQQFELLGRLTDSDRYDALAAEIRQQCDAETTARATAAGAVRALTERTQQLQSRLAELDAQRGADSKTAGVLAEVAGIWPDCAGDAATVVQRLRDKIAGLQVMVDDHVATDRVQCESELRALDVRERTLANQIAEVQASMQATSAALAAARDRHCPTCGQALPEADTRVHDGLLSDLRRSGDRYRQLLASRESCPDDRARLSVARESVLVRARSNEALDAQLRQLRAFLTILSSTADPGQDNRRVVLGEELAAVTAQLQVADVELRRAEAAAATLSALQQKLFSKNSRLMMRMTASVFEALCARINAMVGDPGLASVDAIVGKTLDCAVSFGGNKPVHIGGMSAGQRRLLDVLMMLALAGAFARRSRNPAGLFGLAFYDEVVTYLDPAYLEIVQQAIAGTAVRTRVMITHDEALASYFNQIIRVTRANGLSHYEAVGIDGAITEELTCDQ